MVDVMSSAHGEMSIAKRFSASAPELSSASSTNDVVTPSNLRSYSASQSDESLPRPPLIIVSSSTSSVNKLKLSEHNNESSSRIDGRLLTTSHCDNNTPRVASSSNSTPIMSTDSDVALPNNDHVQSQPEEPSSTADRNPTHTMEEVAVLQEALGQRIDELRRALIRHQRRARGVSLRGCWNAFRGFFGYGPEGTNARKELVSLIIKLAFGLTQVVVIIVLLVLGAANKSPVDHSVNEWQACHRPLGIWSALWSVRAVLGCFVAIWMFRHRSSRMLDRRNRRNNALVETNDPQPDIPEGIAQSPALNNVNNAIGNNVNTNDNANALHHRNNSPVARLGSVLSLASAIWFIVAHAFLYTSTTTCRFSAPHLWWLTFGIVCIGYIVILELLVVIVLIFIIGPLLMLTINMILICLGREPLQLTSSQPKVGKLSLKAVEAIPLVLYIPAPVNKNPDPTKTEKDESVSKPETAHVHAYPPQRDCPSPSSFQSTGTRVHSRRSKRWFTFRRISPSKKETESDSKELPEEDTYEDKWEKGEYPFVRLEENRAVCAICLCDFEEPRRVRYSIGSMPPLDQEEKAIGGVTESPTRDTEDHALRLADVGEGAQPLRLLDCAHVFHKTCIDPWLTEVSGRCPVCQRAVEPKEYSKRRQRRT